MSERLVYYNFGKEVRIDAPCLRGVTIATCPNEKLANEISEMLDAAQLEGQGRNADFWRALLQDETPKKA